MTPSRERPGIIVAGHRLEYEWVGEAANPKLPTLVFLHEGLGCVEMWRGFPERVSRLTGCRALVYSRWGYGASDAVTLPRPLTYMHDEARDALPELLRALDVERAVLVGHSDGGSIALLYAGAAHAETGAASSAKVSGLVLMAAHVFCEDLSVTSIREARAAFEQGGLREKLARYHGANVDGAFWGWNEAWLDPGFRRWNIEPCLPSIDVPVLAIQGDADRYGTIAQVDAIERGVRGPFKRLVIEGCGHDPTRDAPDLTAETIARFVRALDPTNE